MSTTSSSTPATTYCPPSPDDLAQFAHRACHTLGAEFAEPEVVRGFARAYANNLNRQQCPAPDSAAD